MMQPSSAPAISESRQSFAVLLAGLDGIKTLATLDDRELIAVSDGLAKCIAVWIDDHADDGLDVPAEQLSELLDALDTLASAEVERAAANADDASDHICADDEQVAA